MGNASATDAQKKKNKNVISEHKVEFADENVLSSYLGLKGFSASPPTQGASRKFCLSKADSVDSGHHSTLKNHCSVQTETEDETIQL